MQADSAQQQGLYRPEFDHDACGIGALADINGERHHQILDDALSILVNLSTAAARDSRRTPATVPASCSRFRITFSKKRPKSAARFCRQRATMAWPCCSFRRTIRA